MPGTWNRHLRIRKTKLFYVIGIEACIEINKGNSVFCSSTKPLFLK